MLDIPACKITTGMRTASHVPVKKLFGVISDVFKPGHRKSLAAAADAVYFVVKSSAGFPDSAFGVLIVEDKCIGKDSPWSLTELTSKNKCTPSALQRMQELCRTYGSSVPCNVCSVGGTVIDAFTAFVSPDGDEAFFIDLKESYATEKAGFKNSFVASEEKLVDVDHFIKAFEYAKYTLDELSIKVDEARARLKTS